MRRIEDICVKEDCYFYDHTVSTGVICKFNNCTIACSDCSNCPYYITRNHARIVVVNYVKDRKGE